MIVVSSCIFNLSVLGIFLVLLLYFNLNCLCANLAYGLPELNKLTYLLRPFAAVHSLIIYEDSRLSTCKLELTMGQRVKG